MVKKLRRWIISAMIAGTIGFVAVSEPPASLGGWQRPFPRVGFLAARRSCTPLIVESSVPEQPKEADKEPPLPAVDKDLRVNVKNLADLLRKGNAAGARKFADAVAPTIEDFADLEHLYRARNKGGLGWGPMPGPIPMRDSLERGFLNLPKNVPAALALKANNEEAAYWIAAIAELTIAKAPQKDFGPGKTRKFWIDTATKLRAASVDLAYASVMGDVNQMKAVAPRLNATCTACHVKFRE